MSGPNYREISLLVASGEEFNRDMLVQMARSIGFMQIHQARDGLQALAHLKDQTRGIKCVLCDLDLPKKSALELLKEVRTGKAGVPRELRFAVLTAEPSSSVVQMAVQLNLDAFILKPASLADLEKRLAHILTTARKLGSPATYDAVVVPKTVEPEETPAPVPPPRPRAAVLGGGGTGAAAAAAAAFRGAGVSTKDAPAGGAGQAGRRPGAAGGKLDPVEEAIIAARAGYPKKIRLAEIQAGWVLARPVIGTAGTPLFDEGTMLTEGTLQRIRDISVLMNFDSIWVYR
jgi:CheY-like chemotaxis protein